MKPKSYHRRHGCHDCRYVVVTGDHDEEDSLWCSFDAPPRPRCGSVSMGEQHGQDVPASRWEEHLKAAAHERVKWLRWCSGRDVDESGRCDEWKERRD